MRPALGARVDLQQVKWFAFSLTIVAVMSFAAAGCSKKAADRRFALAPLAAARVPALEAPHVPAEAANGGREFNTETYDRVFERQDGS